MLFLEASTDDSSSQIGDQRLFMAGYLDTAETWAKFSSAWDRALKARPSIDYLKMTEAWGLRDQFAGFDERQRNKKLKRLAKIIQQFGPFSYSISVSRVAFERLLRPYSPYGLAKPHFTCVFAIVSLLARYVEVRGLDAKVDFIFDRQDEVSADIWTFFDHMSESLPDSARRLIGGTPRFLRAHPERLDS